MPNQQGFLANLELDGLDITTNVQSTPLTRTKGTLNKAVQDNSGEMQSIPGMSSGTLNVTGWLDTDEHNALEVTWAKDVAVPFKLTVEAGLTTDPGWSGDVTLTSFEVAPVEDGLWTFSLSGDTSGVVTYTPSAV